MNKPVCTPPQLNFWIICALFMIVAVSPQLDLAVSTFFFRDNRFYLGDWGFFPFFAPGLAGNIHRNCRCFRLNLGVGTAAPPLALGHKHQSNAPYHRLHAARPDFNC